MSLITGDEQDALRIPISMAYLAGRKAYAEGKGFEECPYGNDRYTEHLDWNIGYGDAADSVSVEFRAEAEENGERY